MVVAQGNIHNWADHNLALHHHGSLDDVVHSENGTLRGVNDGRREHGAKNASVGDGKAAAGHLVKADFAVAHLGGQVFNSQLYLSKTQLVGIPKYRNHQSLGPANGHRNIGRVEGDHVVAVYHARHRRVHFKCAHRCQGKKAHEPKTHAVLGGKSVLVEFAKIHNGLHVDLVEGRQHGRFVFDAYQAGGELAAQRTHAGAGLAATRLGRSAHRSLGVHRIVFGNAAVFAAPSNLA